MRLIDGDEARRRIVALATGLHSEVLPVDTVMMLLAQETVVDAVSVVRCKDCEYSYDEISYLCCSHGVCVDCEVPPNFYCAEGKRKENDND